MNDTMTFDYRTHNGEITIQNTNTGEHRTLRIRTQKPDASFAPGKRILSLMTGRDNESNYTGFAFIEDGQIRIWSKHKGSKAFQWLAYMIGHPQEMEAKGYSYMYAGRCIVCNRKLTNPQSITTGIGPECSKR